MKETVIGGSRIQSAAELQKAGEQQASDQWPMRLPHPLIHTASPQLRWRMEGILLMHIFLSLVRHRGCR
jgi:hypothetical protein